MRLTSAPNPLILKLFDSGRTSTPGTVSGEFSGLAATWEIDRGQDRFEPGAFRKSLDRWRERGTLPPLLWSHDHRDPAGAVLTAEETDEGLEVSGRLATTTDTGRKAYELMRTGPGALALSVSIIALDAYEEDGVRVITEADWIELSLTPVPMQAGAVVRDVKTLFPDRKTFEHAVRNALGLSASQAKCLAAGGWARLSRQETDQEPELDPTTAATLAEALERAARSL